MTGAAQRDSLTTFHADGGDGNDTNEDLLCQTTTVNPGKTLAVSDSESDKAVAHAATRTERLSKPPEPSVSMAETGQRYE
jgi:hypothetical protein